jgi:hypothetical protein
MFYSKIEKFTGHCQKPWLNLKIILELRGFWILLFQSYQLKTAHKCTNRPKRVYNRFGGLFQINISPVRKFITFQHSNSNLSHNRRAQKAPRAQKSYPASVLLDQPVGTGIATTFERRSATILSSSTKCHLLTPLKHRNLNIAGRN